MALHSTQSDTGTKTQGTKGSFWHTPSGPGTDAPIDAVSHNVREQRMDPNDPGRPAEARQRRTRRGHEMSGERDSLDSLTSPR